MIGFGDLVGVDNAPLSKKMAVKKFYWLPGRFEQNLFITCRNRHITEKKMGLKLFYLENVHFVVVFTQDRTHDFAVL